MLMCVCVCVWCVQWERKRIGWFDAINIDCLHTHKYNIKKTNQKKNSKRNKEKKKRKKKK